MATPKWYTCTPVRFPGDDTFFHRESGLFCKAFQKVGVESMAVMPGPARDGDSQEDLIRTDYSNLENPDWWKSLGLDGVVFYAWGSPRYTKIARAIHESGTFLASSIDASGLMSPYRAFPEYARLLLSSRMARQGIIPGSITAAAALTRSLVPGLFDRKRLEHLSHADCVTVVTPQGAEIMKDLANRFGYPAVADKVRYLPHPQLSHYAYDGTPKENLIVTVGRWQTTDWHQKNPKLLLQALAGFFSRRDDYRAVIVGNSSELLLPLIDRHCPEMKDRIELVPFVTPPELRDLYVRSKIGFWASSHEGQQGTGAQALCCGCSVVSTGGVAMSCFAHYASRASGRQSLRNDSRFLSDALLLESLAWDDGSRHPERIAHGWCAELHEVNVAKRVLDLARNLRPATPNPIPAI
jgi:hypothetical protein